MKKQEITPADDGIRAAKEDAARSKRKQDLQRAFERVYEDLNMETYGEVLDMLRFNLTNDIDDLECDEMYEDAERMCGILGALDNLIKKFDDNI